MKTFKVIKLNRGEYNLVDENDNILLTHAVSEWDANQERQNFEVFERILVNPGILKVVQKFVNAQRWEVSQYGSLDQVIRNYARFLHHSDMRKMMQKPSLFYKHLLDEYAKNKAAREANIPS